MQNTSNIQNIPTTLIQNFFVAGVQAETLINCIKNNRAVNMPPEVLFHLYDSRDSVSRYLQYVFPQKVTVEFKPMDPRFFTFMSTDDRGFNQYFHVLTFYEEINEAEIQREDFDIIVKIWNKQQERECARRKKKEAEAQKRLPTPSLGTANALLTTKHSMFQSHDQMLQNRITKLDKSRPQAKIFKQPIDEDIEQIMETKNHQQRVRDEKMKKEMQGFSQGLQKKIRRIDNLENGGAPSRKPSNSGSFLTSVMLQAPADEKNPSIMRAGTTNNPAVQKANSLHKNRSSPSKFQHVQEMLRSGAMPTNPRLFTNTNYLKNIQQTPQIEISHNLDEELENQAKIIRQSRLDNHEEGVVPDLVQQHQKDMEDFFVQEREYGVTTNFMAGDEPQMMIGGGDDVMSDSNFDEELYRKKRYVPVSLVLSTETEYHDIFRQILMAIFDMIRVPSETYTLPSQSVKHIESRKIAFADLVAHLAFLKTIPAPPFNSVYHIHMLPVIQGNNVVPSLHCFTLREHAFDELPRRSLTPIKVLFDVLDVRSIMYCWKALLFDKSLILVSSQYSLQFYVGEALKQLLFPMTWQNYFILPGNKQLVGLADGTMSVVYGSNPSSAEGFDYFESMSPSMAVCDIDGCFTNAIEMPELPNEQMYIRILNMLKNTKISNYDRAYHSGVQMTSGSGGTPLQNSQFSDHSSSSQIEDFVIQVRETFFTLLKPFLNKVEDFIDPKQKSNTAIFGSYFRQAEYLEHFETMDEVLDECQQKSTRKWSKFAQSLLESSQFQHFCDDYFSTGDLNNYKMYKAILKKRGENMSSAADNEEVNKVDDNDNRQKTFQNLEQIRPKPNQKGGMFALKPRWPETQPVVFNFRMPTEAQKAMLFERIQYKIEMQLAKREMQQNESGRMTHIIENKQDLKYEEIISDIRHAFFQGFSRCKGAVTSSQGPNIGKSPTQIRGQTTTNNQFQVTFGAKYQEALANVKTQLRKEAGGGGGPLQQQVLGEDTTAQSPHIVIETLESRDTTIVERLDSNPQTALSTPPLRKVLTTNFDAQQKLQQEEQSYLMESYILQQSQGGIPLQQNLNYFYEQEYKRVRMCHKRISRLMYGKAGLLTFMHHLFALFDEESMRTTLHYYQCMRQQIEALEEWERGSRQQLNDRKRNKIISEESNEDEEERKSMDFGTQTPANKEPIDGGPEEKEDLTNPIMIQSNNNSSVNINKISGNISANSGSSHAMARAFRHDREWLSISDWHSQTDLMNSSKLRRTQQYVIFKMKLFEAFETSIEDGHSLIWLELLKHYNGDMQLFPQIKFMNIWDALTVTQQDEWFTRYGQVYDKTPQVEMILKLYVKARSSIDLSKRASTSVTSDENLFRSASIKKTWLDKKREAESLKADNNQSCVGQQQQQPSLMTAKTIGNTFCNSTISQSTTQQQANRLSQSAQAELNLFNNRVKDRLSTKKSNEESKKSKNSSGGGGGFLRKLFTKSHKKSSDSLERQESHELAGSSSGESGSQQPPSAGNSVKSHFLSSTDVRAKSVDLLNFDMRAESRIPLQQQSMEMPLFLTDAEKIAAHLLKKIKVFWKHHGDKLERKSGVIRFSETHLEQVVEELKECDKYFDKLKPRITLVASPQEIQCCHDSNEEAITRLQQSFALNLFNFLILYNVTLLYVSTPEGVDILSNYNMWQGLMNNSWVNIGGQRVNCYMLMHQIVRGCVGSPPWELSQFLLENGMPEDYRFGENRYQPGMKDLSDLDHQLNSILTVKRPDPLVSFGLYLPLKGMPPLAMYSCNDLPHQLRRTAYLYLSKRIQVRDDFNLIILPRLVKWFKRDLAKSQDNIDLILALHKLVYSEGKSNNRISPFTQYLEKINKCNIAKQEMQITYAPFSWQFKARDIAELLKKNANNNELD